MRLVVYGPGKLPVMALPVTQSLARVGADAREVLSEVRRVSADVTEQVDGAAEAAAAGVRAELAAQVDQVAEDRAAIAGLSASANSAATTAGQRAVEAGQSAGASATRAAEADSARAMAETARDLAEQERLAAEQAAVASAFNARYHDTIAVGRAAVADGESFGVRAGGSDGLTRTTIFRRDSATAQVPVVQVVNPAEITNEVAERQALIRYATVPGYLLYLPDPAGNSTAIRIRVSDGDFDDPVVNRWSVRMGIPELIQRVTDEILSRSGLIQSDRLPSGLRSTEVIRWNGQDYPVWTAVMPNGGMPDFAARYIAQTVAPYLSIPTPTSGPDVLHSSDRTLVGGALVPVLPDMTRMAGWGSSSMEYMGAEIAAEMAPLGVTYYNGGDAGVRAEHTMAQMGSRPALLTVSGGQIPATGGVTVTASNMPASVYLRAFAGTLMGVPGTLSSTADTLTFTRSADGAVVAVAADTPFIPTVGPQYRNAVTILQIGKNNFTSSIAPNDGAAIAAMTDQAFAWLSPLVKRVVVMGHTVNRDTPAVSTLRDRVMTCNALTSATYGILQFDTQGYMCSPQIWIDSGLTPTQADLDAQAMGNKAPSLSLDDLHFNAAGDAAIAKALRRFVVSTLGWYKEPTA